MSYHAILTVSAALLLATTGRVDTISFAPEEDSQVTKQFLTRVSFATENVEVMIAGQDLTEMMGEQFTTTNKKVVTVEVTDTYGAVEGGRPMQLTRSYDSYESEVLEGDEDSDDEANGIEAVVGQSVIFTWNADEEAYDAAFEDDDDGDADLLADLAEDMDMRVVLPEDSMDEGDEWEIPFDQLESLVSPGRNFSGADTEDEKMRAALVEELLSLFDDQSLTCTYAGVVERDDMQLAQIDISIAGEGTLDATEFLTLTVPEESADGLDIQEVTIQIEHEGTGTIWWDTEANRCAAMDFEFELSGSFDATLQMEHQPGSTFEMIITGDLALELEREVTFD